MEKSLLAVNLKKYMHKGFWDFKFSVPTSPTTKLQISFFSTKYKPEDPKVSLRIFTHFPYSEQVSPDGDGYFPSKGKGLYFNPEYLREVIKGLIIARRSIILHNQGKLFNNDSEESHRIVGYD